MFSLTAAAAGTAAAQPPGMGLDFFIMMGLMFVVFYFLLIRPQNQARKRHQEMISNIKRGDTVVTAGGIVAKVVKASEGEEVMVEIADGVQASVVKATITNVRSRTEPAEKKS
ncbi:preprotein translocase subunit YajC [Parvularcula marina]|uniref:Sec translocon accessory complex subunit YajC n=1 Tax=Parvularcula marina TaxID=2292771 RepID=A0A371RF53_9PROT|nr:preprotein translocase subunit YajC [Parvularcula marina]RFB04088.1 preprotein translocase subunit YajC [Parvularcula marina]